MFSKRPRPGPCPKSPPMRSRRTLLHRAVWVATSLACGLPAIGRAAPAPPGVRAEDAWIRWLPGGLPAAGYVKLINVGNRPVTLVGASSDAYGEVGLHRTVTRGGMMQMDPVERLEIAAGASIDFGATGYHLMLGSAKRPIRPGSRVSVELRFADAPPLEVSFVVRQPGGASE